MESGINEIGHAYLCASCANKMAKDYVMHRVCDTPCHGKCNKCNEFKTVNPFMYTMKGKVKERRGLI